MGWFHCIIFKVVEAFQKERDLWGKEISWENFYRKIGLAVKKLD